MPIDEDIEVITDNNDLCDVILVLGDFNLPKARWKIDEESSSVTIDLKRDLICGLWMRPRSG
jgi:hypothetical protein